MNRFFHRDCRILEEHPWVDTLCQVITILLTFLLLFAGCYTWVKNVEPQGGFLNIVDGLSMSPTLSDGQILYPVRREDFSRNDIVCLTLPEKGIPLSDLEKGGLLVKRIIGLPGEHLRIQEDGNIYVDDRYLPEFYLSWLALGNTYQGNSEGRFMDITLGENEYFVMGDNRGNSLDSRAFGPVREDEIRVVVSTKPTKMFLKIIFSLVLLVAVLPLFFFAVFEPLLRNTMCAILERKEALS